MAKQNTRHSKRHQHQHKEEAKYTLYFPDLDEENSPAYSIKEDYVVVFRKRERAREIKPAVFLQLNLPQDSQQKKYYPFVFKGKKGEENGGLILPADLMRYALAIGGPEQAMDPAYLKLLLKKLDFSPQERVIKQESPFADTAEQKLPLLKKVLFHLSWNTSTALKESGNPGLKELFFRKESPLFRLAFFFTSLVIFILLPILSQDAGLSGDDQKHYQHAAKVYRYFSEDDPAALSDPKNKLNYYGQSFDFFTYLAVKWLGMEDNAYEVRHAMVALTGAAAILFTALLVKLFAGYSGALLAMLLMFLSPRFLGHSFNNPMDIPFALGNIFTLYHIIRFLQKLPCISFRSALWIAVGIGWSNGIRIGGLLLVPYLFMFAGLYLLINKWPWKAFSRNWWMLALKGLGTLVLISLSGYLLSLLTWPYALQDIINHPIKAFEVMSDIQVSLKVLYDGAIHWSDNLPWHYISKNILFTVPLIILLGWLLSLLTWFLNRGKGQGYWYFMLWFTIVFPLAFIIYRESNVYGGWRHMIFVYPSIMALAAMAISSLLRKTPSGWIRYVGIAVVVLGMAHPLKHIIGNHPNTYIYFNELSGGIDNTLGRFETDYYTNSLKPASDYFIEEILPTLDTTREVKVISNFAIGYYFRHKRDRVKPLYTRYYDRGQYDWDYAILYCNYLHPWQLKNGHWPPKNTIHEIKVDDVPVAAIVERKNRDDYTGSTLLNEGLKERNAEKVNQAVHDLENSILYDQHNEIAHLDLGSAYTALLRFDAVRDLMDQLLSFYPDYDKALNIKGYSYLVEANSKQNIQLVDEGIRILNMALKSNYKYYAGYYNLALCYGMREDWGNVEYNLKMALKYNSKFKEAHVKMAEYYDHMGKPELAKRYRARAASL